MKKDIKNIIFDADGTLLEVENPYMVIAEKLKCKKEIEKLIEKYFKKKISYQDLVENETKIFKREYARKYNRVAKLGDIEKLLPQSVLKEGSNKLIKDLKQQDKEIAILSSGFMHIVKNMCNIGILKERIYSNQILYDIDSNFHTIFVNVSGEKVSSFNLIMNENKFKISETLYVGDNIWDKQVIEHILNIGGSACIVNDKKKKFAYQDFPVSENFHLIKHLKQVKDII